MLKGISLIFLAPFILLGSVVTMVSFLAALGAAHTPSPYEQVLSQRPQWPEAVSPTPVPTKRAPRATPVSQSGKNPGPFCTQLGGFAGAVARDRDAGSTLPDSIRTLDEVTDVHLYRIMHAIILDLYSNTLLTPAVAQQTTEALCRQGFMSSTSDPLPLGRSLRQ